MIENRVLEWKHYEVKLLQIVIIIIKDNKDSEICFQIKECDGIRENKFENRSSEDKSKSLQTHPQAIYTSRLLNFKNLPEPVNSSDLSSFQFNSGNIT